MTKYSVVPRSLCSYHFVCGDTAEHLAKGKDQSAARWHYVGQFGATVGPVPVARLKSLYQEGALDDTTPIWNRSMSQWTAMQTVPAVWNLVNGLSVESVSSRLCITRSLTESLYIVPSDQSLQLHPLRPPRSKRACRCPQSIWRRRRRTKWYRPKWRRAPNHRV